MVQKICVTLLFLSLGYESFGAEKMEFKNYRLTRGFVIKDGAPVYEGAFLGPEDILYCTDYCVIQGQFNELKVNFSGFGRLKSLWKYKPVIVKAAPKVEKETPKKIEKQSEVESEKNKIQDLELKKIESKIFPIPKDGAIVLHSKGGRVVIVPSEECKSDCNLLVESSSKKSFSKDFKKTEQPAIEWLFSEGDEDSVSWRFVDGKSESRGSFEIKARTKKVLGEVLSTGRPVNFLN